SLSEDLRRRSRGAGGPGLRDPFAPACSGEPAPGSGAAAGAGGADPGQAGRLLSENLEQLLLALAADADSINIAYASCREDAVNLRAQFKSLQLSPPGRPVPQVPAPP